MIKIFKIPDNRIKFDVKTPLNPDDLNGYAVSHVFFGADTVKITAIRSDGISVEDYVSALDGRLTYILKKNMYSSPGILELRLAFCTNSEVLTVKYIFFSVLESAGETISPDNEKNIINFVLEKTDGLEASIKNNADIGIGFDEAVPESVIDSICDFEITPKAFGVYYSTINPVLLSDEYKGMEVPYPAPSGNIVVRNSEGNVKYRYALPFMINSGGASDVFTNNGLCKAWSEKMYLVKTPAVTKINGYYSWQSAGNYLFEFEFTEDDFALSGMPPKESDIITASTCFYNLPLDYILEGDADGDGNFVYGGGIARGNFSWNEERGVWILLIRTNQPSVDYFNLVSKTYFYYVLGSPYIDKSNIFAMALSKGDVVAFESDFDYSFYTGIPDFLYSDYKQAELITEVLPETTLKAYIPTSLKSSVKGFLNAANALNNSQKNSVGGSDTGYAWIGNAEAEKDYTDIIQKKIDEAYTLGGGNVVLGNGEYIISSSLVLYSNVNLYGDYNTGIIQTADNTHALIVSGSNIEVRDLTVKLSGSCTQDTACIYINSNNTEDSEQYNSTYPINRYAQHININNVTCTGQYKFDWNGDYVVISEAYENYKGCGIMSDSLFFNYAFINDCRFSYLYAGINGDGGSNQYNITCSESKIGVISTGGYNVFNIFGHSYYGFGTEDKNISMSDCVVLCSTGEFNNFIIKTYDEQWYRNIIIFEGLSMGNKYDIIHGSVSSNSNISDSDKNLSVLETLVKDFGRGNRAIAYMQNKPYYIGSRYKAISGMTSLKEFNPVIDNILSGAGIWGTITSNITFDEFDITLKDICRYPVDRNSMNINGVPCIRSSVSPTVENPIEIEIDLNNRRALTYPNLFIQFSNSYVASDFVIGFDTTGSGEYDTEYSIQNNTDVVFYYMRHQDVITNIFKIKISIIKALQIADYQYQSSNYEKYTMDYNEDGLVGICNIGMVGDDYSGRSFLSECGGKLYGNLDLQKSYLGLGMVSELPDPSENYRGRKIILLSDNGDSEYTCLFNGEEYLWISQDDKIQNAIFDTWEAEV